jgi:hypothetical protein
LVDLPPLRGILALFLMEIHFLFDFIFLKATKCIRQDEPCF